MTLFLIGAATASACGIPDERRRPRPGPPAPLVHGAPGRPAPAGDLAAALERALAALAEAEAEAADA